MAKKRELPNGKIASFPDSMSDDEISEVINNKFKNNLNEKNNENFLQKSYRLGVRDPLVGLSKAATNIANIPSDISNSTEKLFPEGKTIARKMGIGAKDIPRVPEYDVAGLLGQTGNPSPEDDLIQSIAQYAPSIAFPAARLGSIGNAVKSIPKAGGILERMLANSIPQAGYAASQSKDSPLTSASIAGGVTTPFTLLSELAKSPSKKIRTGVKLGSAALGGVLGHELGKSAGLSSTSQDVLGLVSGALGARGYTTKKEMGNKLLEGAESSTVKPRLEAAERLGLEYLTPAEASLSPFLAAKQGSLGKTSEGSRLLYEKGKKRVESEEKSISNLLDTIYNKKELEPKTNALYKIAGKKEIPQNFLDSIKDNEIIKKSESIVNSNPAYKESLKNVPKNTINYWDHVKQALDDLIDKAPRKEARILNQTRKELLKKMDKISPEYKEARSTAERGIVRKKLEKAFNKKEMTGSNFYKAIENKEVFDKLLHSLRKVPEAQQKLKDMKLLFKDLLNVPTVKTAAALEKTSMGKERSSAQMLENFMKNVFTGGRADKAAINFITDKKWEHTLKEIEKISNKQKKTAKLIDLLGKASSQAAGRDQ